MPLKVHYDKMLSGVTACGRSDYEIADENIKKVTCKSCLHKVNYSPKKEGIWRCNYCDCSNQGSREICWHCGEPK